MRSTDIKKPVNVSSIWGDDSIEKLMKIKERLPDIEVNIPELPEDVPVKVIDKAVGLPVSSRVNIKNNEYFLVKTNFATDVSKNIDKDEEDEVEEHSYLIRNYRS